jgi:four helix bundle protein
MAKGDDIEERLIDCTVRVIRLCDELPKSRASNHLAGQLLRSGTAPAAHYAEARGAESNRDFIHKLGLCLKELNESRVWLRIITRSGILPVDSLGPIGQECSELCRILNASIRTAKKKR